MFINDRILVLICWDWGVGDLAQLCMVASHLVQLSFGNKTWKLTDFYAELRQTLHAPVLVNEYLYCHTCILTGSHFGGSIVQR